MPSIDTGGDDVLSVAIDGFEAVHALANYLRSTGEWLEDVPGIASVAVRFDAATVDAAAARERLLAALAVERKFPKIAGERIEIPVVYGGEFGPDFTDVCLQLRLEPAEFIALHTGREYRVELVGFTPGFVYAGGLDHRLRVSRKAEPRQDVPAGSVGIADGRTGLYALRGPGGWPLIGRTPFALFRRGDEDPFPISAGMRIRFVAIDASEAGW